jgi:hypothetical protein
MPRHRHQEWIKFLKLMDQQAPAELDLHLIVDNYSTHKHPKVLRWLNMVERWFREITDRRIWRDTFKSVPNLIAVTDAYIAEYNENPRSFIWTAKAENIAAKVRRAREVLDKKASE